MARRRKRPARGFSASATQIDLTDDAERRQESRRPLDWQAKAWRYYDLLGEVRYGAWFSGNALSKLRPFGAVQPDPTEAPVPVTAENSEVPEGEAAIVDRTVARLRNPESGPGEIVGDIGVNWFISGEAYLVSRDDEEGERWDAYSTDEVDVLDDDRVRLRSTAETGMTGGTTVPIDDIARLWRRHPRFSDDADSPMRAVLDVCEELYLLSRVVRSQAASALSAGMVWFPEGMDLTDIDEPGDNPPSLLDDIAKHLTTPVEDPGSAAAIVPYMGTAHPDDIAAITRITFDRAFDEVSLKLREELIRRLANGLDLPPEVLLGLADVNHWTAWQIDEQTFKAHIEPAANSIYAGLTDVFLRPLLEAEGVADPERFMLWYDAERLVTHPNRGEAADRGFDRGALSWESWRGANGFTDADAPEPAELEARARLNASRRGANVTGPPANDTDVDRGPPELSYRRPVRAIERRRGGESPPVALLAAASSGLDGLGFRMVDADRQLRRAPSGGGRWRDATLAGEGRRSTPFAFAAQRWRGASGGRERPGDACRRNARARPGRGTRLVARGAARRARSPTSRAASTPGSLASRPTGSPRSGASLVRSTASPRRSTRTSPSTRSSANRRRIDPRRGSSFWAWPRASRSSHSSGPTSSTPGASSTPRSPSRRG